MTTCAFNAPKRCASEAFSTDSEAEEADSQPPKPLSYILGIKSSLAPESGFRFSKITKLLASSTTLCSAVLFMAAAGVSPALAVTLTAPVKESQDFSLASEDVLVQTTETSSLPYGIFADNSELTFTGNKSISLEVDFGGISFPTGIDAEGDNASLTITTWKDIKIYSEDNLATGIYSSSSVITINDVDNITVNIGGESLSQADGIQASGYGVITINALDTVAITATGYGSVNALSLSWGGKLNITAATVNLTAIGGDSSEVYGIYGFYSSEAELIGTDVSSAKLEINVTKPAELTASYDPVGANLIESSLSVSKFKDVNVTVNGAGGIGLRAESDSLQSSVEFKDIGTATINAATGVLAYRIHYGQESGISLAADKISITSNNSAATEYKLAGIAVTSVFSVDEYYGSAGEDDRIALVSLKGGEVEITADQAFAAVITNQNKIPSGGSLRPQSLKALSAATGTSVNSIISVMADTLTVTASDFVAVAYSDLAQYLYLFDGDTPIYNPDYDSGQTGQVNLNVTVDSDGTAAIHGTSILNGNVLASHNSQVNIGLGSGSTWTGFSQDSRVDPLKHEYTYTNQGQELIGTIIDSVPGEVNVYATDGATWNVRPIKETTIKENSAPSGYGKELGDLTVSGTKSYLTSWNSTDSSVINLDLTAAADDISYYGYEYQSVDIKYLQGSGTEFQVHTNIDGDRGSDSDFSSLTTDHAIIHSGEGAHYIYVAASGSGSITEQAGFLILHLEEDGASSVTITPTWDDDHEFVTNTEKGKSGTGDNPLSFTLADKDGNATVTVAQGLYYYSLATRTNEDTSEYGGAEGASGTEWYLVRSSYQSNTEPEPEPEPDPEPDPDPEPTPTPDPDPEPTPDPEPDPDPEPTPTPDPDPEPTPTPDPDPDPESDPDPGTIEPGPSKEPETNEGRTVAALSGIGNKLSMHYAQLDDLRKRLGEIRYGAQDGLWVRYIYQIGGYDGVSFSTRAKQNLHAINLGIDRIVSQDEDSLWLLGGNFKYGHDNEKIKSARGKGNLNSYGLNLYATYASQYGCYTDLVLSVDNYHQKMGSKLEDNSSANGKFNTWGWGASIEIGKMFSSTQNDENWGPWHNHWWVEPQAQLSYYWIKGKDFSMNNGMTVSQHNGDSLVGRLGVVVGKQWNYGGAAKVDKRYVQAYVKGGVKHEFLGNQKTKINDVAFDHKLRGTAGYYGGGVDWNLTKRVRAYAQVERDAGGRYKKDIEASVGLKWQF